MSQSKPGEAHSNAKLTDDQVREIRRLYATTKTSHLKLAVRFGVSHSVIQEIVDRKAWRHL